MATPTLTIDRLAIRGQGGAATRRRAVARLEAFDLTPPGPPAEVLIVRRLSDPLPGALAAPPQPRRQAPGPGAWAVSLVARLAALRREAARPARGTVPADAEAVLFADEAEMLACLAEALAKARGAELWWARALGARLHTAAAPAEALAAAAALLPAVLALLAERGSAACVLARLSADEARRLWPLLGLSPDWADAPPAHDAAGPPPDGSSMLGAAALPPPALASALAALPRPAAALLAAGWLRRQRPDAAPAEVARRAAALLATSEGALPPGEQAPQPAKAESSRPTHGDVGAAADPAAAESAEREAPAADAPPPDGPSLPWPRAAKSRLQSALAGESSGEYAAVPLASGHADAGKPQTNSSAAPAVSAAAWQADVATRLGGLFFLVNLYDGAIPARAPALAAALETARRPDDGPWAALERLARALLSDQSMPTDPAWRLLATLDGRAADVPLDVDAADAAAAAVARAWIAAAAWGPRGPDAGESVAQLLRAEAQLHATSVHLDVVLPADAVRLPARRAGLDLDPGWSPRFGRIVAFHYHG